MRSAVAHARRAPQAAREAILSGTACRLAYHSVSPHLQQLYTGFLMLHRGGFIRLSQTVRRTPVHYGSDAPHLKDADHAHLDAVLDGNIRLHFDTHDSREIAFSELDPCDVYFKRSYSPAVLEALPPEQRRKVRPLGLNYEVLPDVADPFALRRSLSLGGISRRSLTGIKQALDAGNHLRFRPRLARMQASPDLNTDPRVLFLVAAYDPYNDPARSPDKVEERIQLNDGRARCISALRAALGDRFMGGFSPSPFARARYPGLLAPPDETCQRNYLAMLKSYPICVATTGLHGSTGWKLAEYVAFAKAILSEALVYTVPGPFQRDRHYLEFSSPEECVAGALRLLEDADLRHALMRNNAAYYDSYLRPDALVRNALVVAMEGKPR